MRYMWSWSVRVACITIQIASAAAQEQIALVHDDRINECSGLAFCVQQDDAVWMHNDSGDKPRLFLVGLDGVTRSVCNLKDAKNVDWEDMCSFKLDGDPWLLIGDVGDNQARRTKKKSPCTLYLLREPNVSEKKKQRVDWDMRIRFEYEDGPHNCEGVAVDVERREILLLTKESPLTCGMYQLPLDMEDRKQKLTAKRIARLLVPFATGLDISRDGRTLAAVNMWDGLICRRKAEQTWGAALKDSIQHIPMPQRKQGEAVCFSPDGKHLLVNSERKRQPLWRLQIAELGADSQ